MSGFDILLIILATLLILIIALQSKGTGLSIVPGSDDFGKFERRGPERTLHQGTIILVAVFIVLCAYIYFTA